MKHAMTSPVQHAELTLAQSGHVLGLAASVKLNDIGRIDPALDVVHTHAFIIGLWLSISRTIYSA
jgi:hypothetical protein